MRKMDEGTKLRRKGNERWGCMGEMKDCLKGINQKRGREEEEEKYWSLFILIQTHPFHVHSHNQKSYSNPLNEKNKSWDVLITGL